MLTRVVLDELERDGKAVPCSAEVAASLNATGLVEMRPAVGGGFTAHPTANVGAARVGDVQLEVRPKDKVGVAQVLFLLGYAESPGFLMDEVFAETDDDLLAVLAESLARQARRALSGGVHRGYVAVEEASRTVRGRIRMGDQLTRRPGMMYPVEVTYDEYSPDIAENRILRTAIARMALVPHVADETLGKLAELDAALDGVEILTARDPIPQWVPSRLNERYHAALALAEMVLRYQSAQAGAGGLDIAAFVVPMWKVYEDFVSVALREALDRYPGSTVTQFPSTLDERQGGVPPVSMEVDIVHEVGGRPVIIADAKYKAASPSGRYPNADQYQMLAYCTALGLPRAWLVYAQGTHVPVVRKVRHADVEIVEWPLDLSVSSAEILAQVDELAGAMWANSGVVQLRTAG